MTRQHLLTSIAVFALVAVIPLISLFSGSHKVFAQVSGDPAGYYTNDYTSTRCSSQDGSDSSCVYWDGSQVTAGPNGQTFPAGWYYNADDSPCSSTADQKSGLCYYWDGTQVTSGPAGGQTTDYAVGYYYFADDSACTNPTDQQSTTCYYYQGNNVYVYYPGSYLYSTGGPCPVEQQNTSACYNYDGTSASSQTPVPNGTPAKGASPNQTPNNSPNASGNGLTIPNPLKGSNTLYGFVSDLINGVVLPIGGVLAVFYIMYAGFLMVTARGNEDQIKKGRAAFTHAAIGTAILLGAWVIATVIENTIKSLTG